MADSLCLVESPSQPQARLTVQQRVELLAGYTAGVLVRDLASRFQVHRTTVSELARRTGGRATWHGGHDRAARRGGPPV